MASFRQLCLRWVLHQTEKQHQSGTGRWFDMNPKWQVESTTHHVAIVLRRDQGSARRRLVGGHVTHVSNRKQSAIMQELKETAEWHMF
jgi:hypothetical protein